MSEIIRPKDTWYLTNTYNQTLTISDLPKLPPIKSKQKINALQYETYDNLNRSTILRNYINKKWIVTDEYLHTHDDKSDKTHVISDHPDTNATGSQLDILTGGSSSNADFLHTHDLKTHSFNEHSDTQNISLNNIENLLNGSNADSLHTHSFNSDHNKLNSIQGGFTNEYYHLKNNEYTGLVNGNNADNLHTHDLIVHRHNLDEINDITATSTEINTALDGIGTNVTASNLTSLTDGSNADSLHTHTSSSSASIHNDLDGLQGGETNNYFHLSEEEYNFLLKFSEDSSGLLFDGQPIEGGSSSVISGVSEVTASLPLSSSGGSSPNITLSHNTTNLQITTNELNTIQNIATTSSPTFGGMTLNGNLVLGSNTLTTSNNTVITNLNADLLDGNHAAAFALSAHNHDHNTLTNLQGGEESNYFHLNEEKYDLILKLSEDSSGLLFDGYPIGGTSGTIISTSIHNDLDGLQGGIINEYFHLSEEKYNFLLKLEEDSSGLIFDGYPISELLTFVSPLNKSNDNEISLNYNTTNLQITTNQLNTIQNIATTSSPQFAYLGIGSAASIGTSTAGIYVISSSSTSPQGLTGVSATVNCTRGAGTQFSIYGLYFQANYCPTGATANRTCSALIGCRGTVTATNEEGSNWNSTTTTAYGVFGNVSCVKPATGSGSVAITTAYNFYCGQANASNGATIGTVCAFYDVGQIFGTVANWGIAINTTNNYINGKLTLGTNTAPTAKLHLAAGTATASTAPLKFTSGTSLTAAEAGVVEFTTDDLYFTITTGTARKGFVLNDGTNLTSGRISYATTNGRLTDSANLTFTGTQLNLTGNADFSGHFALGSAGSVSSTIGINYSDTITDASFIGADVFVTNNKNGNVTLLQSIYAKSTWTPTITSGLECTSIIGVESEVATILSLAGSSMLLSNAYCFHSSFTSSETAGDEMLIDNLYLYYAKTVVTSTNTSIEGNLYAFYDQGQNDENINVGEDANIWGIGINTTNNYINGNLSIGKNTAPTVALDVVGSSIISGNMTINGADANVLTLGNGGSDIDYILKFNGETNDGTITWMEDADYFSFDKSIFIATATPSLHIYIGDANTSLYNSGGDLHLDTDSSKTLVLDTVVWEDLRVPVTSTKVGTANEPGFAQFKTNGSGSTGVYIYWFDNTQEEELFFVVQLPHAWDCVNSITPHIHWTIGTADAGGTQTVKWGLEYTWRDINETFGNTSIVYTSAVNGLTTAGKHIISDFTALSPNTGYENISSILICRVFRDVANDTYGYDAGLIEIDFHYSMDTLGSRQISTK